MADLSPRVDFASLTDADIALRGLSAAKRVFDALTAGGYVNGDSLAVVVGVKDEGRWAELGRKYIGPDAERFLPNIDPVTGKLATVLRFGRDSVEVYHQYGAAAIPEGPQRWTGAVHHFAIVETEMGWMTREFVGAASGVQGHFDMTVVYAALTHMGACWALRMQALHGKPS